jgi:hypothetical protein
VTVIVLERGAGMRQAEVMDTKANSAAPAGTPLGGMAVAVDVAGIEKELASLWRTQSQEQSKALTRACAWNLIVYTTDDDAAARAKQFADKLVSSVPTRTILVKNQPYASTGKPIEAWVSANCHVGDLNWLRTASLRSLLASLFDPPGGHQPLWNIARVKVSTSSMSAARLLLGWLTSRLKWTVQERIARSTGASWRLLSRDEEPINVDVELLTQAVRGSGLDRLVLETTSGERYGFAATEGSVVQVEGPGALARAFSAAEPPDEQLLVAALGTRGRDRLSGVALHRALELDR